MSYLCFKFNCPTCNDSKNIKKFSDKLLGQSRFLGTSEFSDEMIRCLTNLTGQCPTPPNGPC